MRHGGAARLVREREIKQRRASGSCPGCAGAACWQPSDAAPAADGRTQKGECRSAAYHLPPLSASETAQTIVDSPPLAHIRNRPPAAFVNSPGTLDEAGVREKEEVRPLKGLRSLSLYL
jgi:hypothetical protein